jgi:hypothetical protein
VAADDLCPNLAPIRDLELSLGNVIERVDRGVWTACPVAVVLRHGMHFDEIAAQLTIVDAVKRWESRDPHYEFQAGFTCEESRHSIAGPI